MRRPVSLPKLYLGVQAIVFTLGGAFLLVSPHSLTDLVGLYATTTTGEIELQVMYGGLQMAIGLLCFWGISSTERARIALTAVLFLFAGVAISRLSLTFLKHDWNIYSVAGIAVESASAMLALYLLRYSSQGTED